MKNLFVKVLTVSISVFLASMAFESNVQAQSLLTDAVTDAVAEAVQDEQKVEAVQTESVTEAVQDEQKAEAVQTESVTEVVQAEQKTETVQTEPVAAAIPFDPKTEVVTKKSNKRTANYFPHRNQLSISYGDGMFLPLSNTVLEVFGGAIAAIFVAPIVALLGGKTLDLKISGMYSYGIADVGYRYVLPGDRFSIGASASYSAVNRSWKENVTDESGNIQEQQMEVVGHLVYVTTGATCYYTRRSWCKLYGALDFGMVFSAGGSPLNETMTMYPGVIGFVANITPLGIQMGNDRVAGFAEMNLGYKGFLNLGIRVSM